MVPKITVTSGDRMYLKEKKLLKCSRQEWTREGTAGMEEEEGMGIRYSL